MAEKVDKLILVDLDAVLDTRIATLMKIDEQATLDILYSGAYDDRKVDDFEKLTDGKIVNEEFINKYHDRDVNTLIDARPTNAVRFVRSITYELGKKSLSGPDVESVNVHLNMTGYDLTVEEQHGLCDALSTFMYPTTLVNPVNIKMSDITPHLLDETYEAFVTYDFNHWYCEHAPALTNHPIPRNTIFAPALYLEVEPPKDVLKTTHGEITDSFRMVEFMFKQLIELQLLPAKSFSLMRLE